MKRCNQPHRKLARSRRVMERLKLKEQSLKGMKGRDNKVKRQKLREMIGNTKRNVEKIS